uniref:Gem (nuclear organelle) associated protein 8 n=1 Tax=Maylandia zebra TaxID=106582 RepID=A0A3P9D298_9CICH
LDNRETRKRCPFPVYSRYWQHYWQAMAWHQRHRLAYRKALQAAYGPCCYQEEGPCDRPRYADWSSAESNREDKEDYAEESSSESEIECDVSNMEISKELRQYFAQTERHREELKNYMPADQDLHSFSLRSSVTPPLERLGERRTAEMKKLYGGDVAKIMALEAAMQLNFERNCDLKQPKYWPVIPLKL